MTSTCGFSIAASARRVSCSLDWLRPVWMLRDDDVEARQQLVGVVEGRVGADLELGAVEDAERGELGVDPRRSPPRCSSTRVRHQAARHPQ